MGAFSMDMSRLAVSKLFDSRSGFDQLLSLILLLQQGCRSLLVHTLSLLVYRALVHLR